MKNLALAILSLAGLPYAASPQVMPQLSKEGVQLHIGMEFNQSWNDYVFESDSAGLYCLPAGASKPVAEFAPLMVDGGVTYYAGKVYVNSFNDEGGSVPEWRVYDLATGKLETSVQGKGMQEDCTNAMTYDISSGMIYGILQNNNGIYLARIAPDTGEKTIVGMLSENGNRVYRCYTLASNRYGELYTIYEPYGKDVGKTRLARVNPATGALAPINGTGDVVCRGLVNDEALISMGNRNALVFNNQTDKLYWLRQGSSLYVGDYYTPIFEVDINTAVATMVGYIPDGMRVTGAFFDEPLLTAPDAVGGLEYVYADGSADRCTGRLTVTAPSTTYEGKALAGTLKIIIAEGDRQFVLDGVAPGGEASTEEQTFSYGEHTFTCKVVGADGSESVTRKFNMFIGYDLPNAPANVRLVNDGRDITLTWDAPTAGIHGGEINKDKLTYRIVRYRYTTEETVCEDFVGTSFTDEATAELARYRYMVCSRYDGRDGYAVLSGSVIAGDPVGLPYVSDFDSEEDFFNQYKIVDANSDGSTWTYDLLENTACYFYSELNDADDWLFTPPALYKAGHTYELAVSVKSGGEDVLDNLAICFGAEAEPQAQQLVDDFLAIPAAFTDCKVRVTPQADGVHFFGLHIHSPRYGYVFRLKRLSITDLTASGIGSVDAPGAAKVAAGYGMIRIDNPEGRTVTVYTAAGGRVAVTAETSAGIPLSPGLYVVKCGGDVVKVVVR